MKGQSITIDGVVYTVLDRFASVIGYTKDVAANLVIPKTVNYNNSVYTVTGVYKKAFQGCTSLKSISLTKTVKIIGQYAFYLSGISSIVLPDNIDTVGDCAFTNMESVCVLAKVPPVITVFSFGTLNDKGMFCMDTELPIRVPAGCKQIYGKAEVWKEFTNIVEEQRPVGLNAINADSAIRYADGMLYLKDTDTQAAITVYTIAGKCIRSYEAITGVCDLSMLPNGVYIARICIDGKVTNIKIRK